VVGYCKERAEAGDYNAMLWLARMYRDGKGVRKNASKALEWYNKSKDYNIFSKFELLGLFSNQKRTLSDIPEGLKIDTRKKEKLFVYKFDYECMNLLINLFPFTHYEVIGYTYKDNVQQGYNENCQDYNKILIASVENTAKLKEELISKGVESKKIITVRQDGNRSNFSGETIICDFGEKKSIKPICVIVPGESNGLIWFYNMLRKFNGPDSSKCDYYIDMQNHFSMMMDPNNIGLYNVWDYYFRPVSNLTLEKIYNEEGVIITKRNKILLDKVQTDINPILSDNICDKIEVEYENIKHKKVLGVICRGTDYVSMQPHNHAVPLDEYELIEIIEERIKNLNFTGIYLSTEDEGAYKTLKNHFGSTIYAIDQKRFGKELTFNKTIIDKNVTDQFGKLIQGERYLIATFLLLRCDATLLSPSSAATLILKQGTKVNEIHKKGVWGLFGKNPLIVRSHNKNHISLLNVVQDDAHEYKIDQDGYLHAGGNKKIILHHADVYLDADKEYICSITCDASKIPSISLRVSSKKEEGVIKLIHGSMLKLPYDIDHGDVIVEIESTENIILSIQIEEGQTITEYKPPIFSETRICLKDDNGEVYASTDLDAIDFTTGVFFVKNNKYTLDPLELERYQNIICYKNGFLTYHNGFTYTATAKDGVGPRAILTIANNLFSNPRKIYGQPMQLRRFSHTVELADNLLKEPVKNVEEALCIYSFHAINGNNVAKYKLAKLYRDGKYIQRNYGRAIELMRNYAKIKIGWATNEFIDLLHKRGNNDDLIEAYELAKEFASKGNSGAMIRLGRMYRDGKGVEKDLDKAIEWMRKATEKNPVCKNEFIDVLWRRSNSEDLRELRSSIEEGVAEEDLNALQWFSRMYRDGKGVEKDLDKAIDLMRKVADKKYGWSRNELIDMLLKRANDDDLTEAFGIAQEFASDGNHGALGRLGRMYRDGSGIKKDHDKAIECMYKAVEGNPVWRTELQELLKNKKEE